VRILEEKGDVPVLGVVPYLKDLYLPNEDAVEIETPVAPRASASPGIDIAILRLPRIANFDDFDPLRAESGVRVRYVSTVHEFGSPDALILPGTKSTIADLSWLRQSGLMEAVISYAKKGGTVVGICGGYQMLGESIHDPGRVESGTEDAAGLGLLPVTTNFLAEKTTVRTQAHVRSNQGWLASLTGQAVSGYEIHMGETESARPWLEIAGSNQLVRLDGAASSDGRIWGCYLHGLFANDNFRHAWLKSLGWQNTEPVRTPMDLLDQSLDTLADTLEETLDMDLLEKIIWET
jgi:adenosylcobyric acid synthase